MAKKARFSELIVDRLIVHDPEADASKTFNIRGGGRGKLLIENEVGDKVEGSEGPPGPAGPKGDSGDRGNDGAPGAAGKSLNMSSDFGVINHYSDGTLPEDFPGNFAVKALTSGYTDNIEFRVTLKSSDLNLNNFETTWIAPPTSAGDKFIFIYFHKNTETYNSVDWAVLDGSGFIRARLPEIDRNTTVVVESRTAGSGIASAEGSYTVSSVKSGEPGPKGEDAEIINTDFSHGNIGWTLDSSYDGGEDLSSDYLVTSSFGFLGGTAFGSNVGKFYAYDENMIENIGGDENMSKPVWLNHHFPVMGAGGDDDDEGQWIVKIRVAAYGNSLAQPRLNSLVRLWAFVKTYNSDGSQSWDNINRFNAIYFESEAEELGSVASTEVGGKLGAPPNTKFDGVAEGAGTHEGDCSLGVWNDGFRTFVASITPQQLRGMQADASSFKIGFQWKDDSFNTSYTRDESNPLIIDAIDVSYLAFTGLDLVSPEFAERIRNNTLAVGNSVTKGEADYAAQAAALLEMGTLVNGDFHNLLSSGWPVNVIAGMSSGAGQVGVFDYNNGAPMMHPDRFWLKNHGDDDGVSSGHSFTLKYQDSSMWDEDAASGTGFTAWQRPGIFFGALYIPEDNYSIRLKVRYKTETHDGNTGAWNTSNDSYKPQLVVYFSEELPAGKTHIVPNSTFPGWQYDGSDNKEHPRTGGDIKSEHVLQKNGYFWEKEFDIELNSTDIDGYVDGLKYFSVGFLPGRSSTSTDGEHTDLIIDYVEARALPPPTLAKLDSEHWQNFQEKMNLLNTVSGSVVDNAANNHDLDERFGHLLDETADADAGTLYNGKLRILDSNGVPDGILLARNSSTPARDDNKFLFSNSGTTIISQGSPSGDSKRRAIFFKAVRIPSEDHRMKVKVTYHRSEGGDSDKPKISVYFLDGELQDGKKYVGTSTGWWKYSPASDGSTGSSLIDTASSNIIFEKEFDALGTSGEPAVINETIKFGDDANTTGGTGKPIWASIAIVGGGEDSTSDLTIKEVSLEWIFGTGAILERSLNNFLSTTEWTTLNNTVTQNAADNSDLGTRFEHLLADTSEDAYAIYNGDLSLLADDSFPKGILIGRYKGSSSQMPKRSSSQTDVDYKPGVVNTGTPGWAIQSAKNVSSGHSSYRRGIWWKKIKIPTTAYAENQAMNITVKYHRTSNNDGTKPDMYVYFTEEDLGADEQYVISATSTWYYSEDEHGTEGDAVGHRRYVGDNRRNLYYKSGGVELTAAGTQSEPATVKASITFGEGSNLTNHNSAASGAARKPKWASVALLGGSGDSTSDLFIHEVTVDFGLESSFADSVLDYAGNYQDKTSSELATMAGVSAFHNQTVSGLTSTVATSLQNNTSFLNSIGSTVATNLENDTGFVADIAGPVSTNLQNNTSFVNNIGSTLASDSDFLDDLNALPDQNWRKFTGKHPCFMPASSVSRDIELLFGKIVSSTGVYKNSTDGLGDAPTIDESLPVVSVTLAAKEKNVFGVISREVGEEVYEINSLGEGGMWVSDAAGFLENGDYICSSDVPGYGMKQDDDILRNYTVAKITQDCMFDLESEDYDCKEVEHNGIIYKVAFVGCTYHCG